MTTAASFATATSDPKISPDFSHGDFTSASAAAFSSGLFAAFLPPIPSVTWLGSIRVSRVAGHRARSRGTGRAPGAQGAPPAHAPPARDRFKRSQPRPAPFLISANPRPACYNSSGGNVPLPQGAGEERQRLGTVGENRVGNGASPPPHLLVSRFFPSRPLFFSLHRVPSGCGAAASRRPSPFPGAPPEGRGGEGALPARWAVGGVAGAAKVRARCRCCTRPSRGGQGRVGPAPLLFSLCPLQL